MQRELSVIIPTHRRSAKLRTLLSGIASTSSDHDAFEVVVVVDGHDKAPLEVGSLLPDSIRFVGLTKDHAGPAAARNHAIRHAGGQWLLFYDDDARVDGQTIPRHLGAIRGNGRGPRAHLGRVDWPRELIDSPWRVLLTESSMLFFWNRMSDGGCYGFRHFWTTNLSVRRDHVQQVGGFREVFPSAIHEDIELGWRLQQALGLRVRVDLSIACLHDHALDPYDYFLREHKSGGSARVSRLIARDFHDEIWSWIGDPEASLDTLMRLFGAPAKEVLELFEAWAKPCHHRPSRPELEAVYLAHLPLKRMFFLQGYLERPFDELWCRFRGAE